MPCSDYTYFNYTNCVYRYFCFDTTSLLLLSAGCYGLGVIDPTLYRGTLDLEEDLQFPEGHLGRLWFSVRFEPATEKLLVSLLKAKNLPSRTVGTVNSCDPFVRLHLIPDERRRYLQSRQKKKTCNPYFDETFVFQNCSSVATVPQVPSKEMEEHILKLSVVDAGRTKRRAVIGHITFPLKSLSSECGPGDQQLFNDGPGEVHAGLRDFHVALREVREAQEPVSDLGEILVSLLYNENLHRLSVTVIAARRLKEAQEPVSDLGEILVSLLYNENLHRLSVTVIAARRLKVGPSTTQTECDTDSSQET
ncbi:unnamed protein product [Timema podura]|uniref:C2 domain-containing protein n=1 Tax=Timema podura TaxID=61482 RepID=A0ABN7P4Z5_TIMPD|nr:unnamed protein product [Timema podura]